MGVWLIYYAIADQDLDSYLAWFEGEHTAEKLARPGYDWAAHYEVVKTSADSQSEFVAMFGSSTSRTFFDPSPAQIKPLQSELTKTMLACRKNAISLILTEEWSEAGADKQALQEVAAPYLRLWLFSDTADDQAVGSWSAQQHFPIMAKEPTINSIRKFVASAGSPRHCIIEESTEVAFETGTRQALENGDLHREPIVASQRIARRV